MTELAEQITVRKSPLDEIHERLGATMIEYDGLHVPALYGDQLFEYATVREGGAGLIDLSLRGRFLVSGSEAIQFLNGLVTNDMNTLDVGNWMPAAFPNVQGRLIASARVIRTHDDQTGKKACPTFLLDTEAVTHHRVLKTIERFTLAGDFRVVDVTMQTALLSLQGKKAAKRVGAVFGDTVAELPKNRVAQIQWQQKQLTIWRATHTGEDGFDLLVDAENAEALWGALIDNGVRPVGYNALEILRIEAGLARYGVDMDESNVVTETNLDDAVSYAKGC
jgi:glycine cleavage system aminomethyltransferase T